MTSERLVNVDLLSVERVRAEKIDLDEFWRRTIKLHWVDNDIKF